jgi:hypothetical protein
MMLVLENLIVKRCLRSNIVTVNNVRSVNRRAKFEKMKVYGLKFVSSESKYLTEEQTKPFLSQSWNHFL